MPQNGLNSEGRRRGARGDTCKANAHVPGAALVNGAVVHDGCPAESAPAGTLSGTKAQCMVNGYINNGYKGKSRKAPPPPPRTLRKQGRTISAVTDASAAGRVSSASFPGGVSVNGPTSPDTNTTTTAAAAAASPCNSDQTAPEPSPSAPAKNQRKWKRFRHGKRPVSTPPPPMMMMPPQEEEDWEGEIQEATVTDWEKESFGIYGVVMPQNGLNSEGRRRGARGDTCEANAHVPGAALVNGAVVHDGCPAESAPAGTLSGTKAQCMVNGYINNGYKGKSRKAPPPPPRTLRKQGRTISAVTDASAAGRVSSASFPGGVSVNGPTSPDTTNTTAAAAAAAASPCNSDQTAPEPSLSAPAKNQRKWKRFRHGKRPVSTPPPPMMMMPPQEEEDWEGEIQEATVTDWEKESFGIRPYGPEDVIHFSLRDLTLNRWSTADLPLTANYRPAVHHRRPLRWSCYSIPTEPDQFADADE